MRFGGSQLARLATSWAIYVVLILSVALNVALARDIWVVKRPIVRKIDGPTGMVMGPVLASDLAGHPVTLNFAGSGESTVIYVFSPECHWCARNLANIRALASARDTSYKFLGLSVQDTALQGYARAARYGFPLYSIASLDELKSAAVRGTPSTIVISPQGRVVKNWVGAYMQSRQQEVESYFGVHLPGLLAVQPGPVAAVPDAAGSSAARE